MDPGVELLLQAFDDARDHAYESWRPLLEGVRDDEACWQPPMYAGEPAEAGWPPPGTIAWQVAHLAHCKRYYAKALATRAAAEMPEADARVPLPDFAAELQALDAAHDRQRAAMRDLSDEDLPTPLCGGRSVADFVLSTTRHDIWHGGQIAVLRRAYRARDAESEPGTV